ncbi:MAG: glycosyltransferase 87 family protein, partial [Polyangiaceae bacterium]
TLPFVGPPACLPLWRGLAHLPYDVAGRIWVASLGIAMLVVIFGSLALARAPQTVPVLLGATIFTAAYGPLISDVSLGQLALGCTAAIIAALLLLPTRAWLLAAFPVACAGLAPNLAVVLLARLGDLRALIAFAAGAFAFGALMASQGPGGIARYLHLLSIHGAAEASTVIQMTPAAISFAFGESAAAFARIISAAIAVALTIVALRRVSPPAMRIGIASCMLPFVVPFFHEHDFVLAILPAIMCAALARGTALSLAAVGATAAGVDWLGLAQRVPNEPQAIVLSLACALGFALIAQLRREAFAALAVPVFVAAICLLARAHPVPIWPDALPPHWQPPPNVSVSAVWEMEQRVAGLDAPDPVWELLRALSLASCALLGFATYLTSTRAWLRERGHSYGRIPRTRAARSLKA